MRYSLRASGDRVWRKMKKALPQQDFFEIFTMLFGALGEFVYTNIAVMIAPTASIANKPTIIVISSFPVSPY